MNARNLWPGFAVVLGLVACYGGDNDGSSSGSGNRPPTPGPSVASYATTFDLTEDPIRDGGIWVNGGLNGLDWNNPETASGRAFASTLSGNPSRYNDSIAQLNIGRFADDQFAQGTVYRAPGYDPYNSKHEVELLLRFEIAAHNARGYEVLWGISGYLAVVRWNGPLGDYTAIYDTGDPGIGPPANGDVLRAEIQGNTIKIYKNGALKATVDTASIGGQIWTTGQPGIGFWPVDGASPDKLGWTDYQAGNLL